MWQATTVDGGRHVHVVPLDDLVEHDRRDDGDCVCGPALEMQSNGAWLIVHAALDRRLEDRS